MKLEKTLYPALLVATAVTQADAWGNTNLLSKNIKETINENSVPLAVVTAGLPLTIDAIIGGKPLTAIGMSVLTGTNAVRLLVAHDKKITITNRHIQKKCFRHHK